MNRVKEAIRTCYKNNGKECKDFKFKCYTTGEVIPLKKVCNYQRTAVMHQMKSAVLSISLTGILIHSLFWVDYLVFLVVYRVYLMSPLVHSQVNLKSQMKTRNGKINGSGPHGWRSETSVIRCVESAVGRGKLKRNFRMERLARKSQKRENEVVKRTIIVQNGMRQVKVCCWCTF